MELGENMIYDIIGDIHGQATKLEKFLIHIGYKSSSGIYSQPGHILVFVGDLVDRGPQQKRVLEIVRPMVTEGLAHVVMGNHEYNAICYHTKSSNSGKEEWLRPHTTAKTHQHENFLREYPMLSEQAADVIDWFKTLPVYLDFGDFRVIHACWDQQSIAKAHKIELLTDENQLNQKQLEFSAQKGTEQFETIERLLKGPEIPGVPPFLDKDGIQREEVRSRWWGKINAESTYRDLAFWYDTEKVSIPDKNVDIYTQLPNYSPDLPAVFFGHYWLNHEIISLQQSNVACLDYSAGTIGPLVAYRFNTENSSKPLNKNNFYYS